MQELHKIEIDGYECQKCGWAWVPRKKEENPKVCPKCHVTTWFEKNKPKRVRV